MLFVRVKTDFPSPQDVCHGRYLNDPIFSEPILATWRWVNNRSARLFTSRPKVTSQWNLKNFRAHHPKVSLFPVNRQNLFRYPAKFHPITVDLTSILFVEVHSGRAWSLVTLWEKPQAEQLQNADVRVLECRLFLSSTSIKVHIRSIYNCDLSYYIQIRPYIL